MFARDLSDPPAPYSFDSATSEETQCCIATSPPWSIMLAVASLVIVCWEKHPLSTHLSVGLPQGIFKTMLSAIAELEVSLQCQSMSVGIFPKWRRSLRLCCANLTVHTISDMAVGLNPELTQVSQIKDDTGLTTSEIGSI